MSVVPVPATPAVSSGACCGGGAPGPAPLLFRLLLSMLPTPCYPGHCRYFVRSAKSIDAALNSQADDESPQKKNSKAVQQDYSQYDEDNEGAMGFPGV